jgi:hypothetical protein
MLNRLTIKPIFSQKGFAPIMPLLIFAVIMGGLILTVSMVRQPQIINSKAAEPEPSHNGLQTAPAGVPFFGVSVGESNITTPASNNHEVTITNQTHATSVPTHNSIIPTHTPTHPAVPTHTEAPSHTSAPAHTPAPTHAPNEQQCISQLTCHYHQGWCQDQLSQGRTLCPSQGNTTSQNHTQVNQNNNQANVNHPSTPVHSVYHGYCNVIGVVGLHCNN